MLRLLLPLFVTLSFYGCNSDSSNSDSTDAVKEKSKVYYGDVINDRVLVININTMSLVNEIEKTGRQPYEVTQLGDTIVSINRKDFNLNLIEDNAIIETVSLPFQPRSLSYRDKNIVISSVSEPSIVVSNKDFSEQVVYNDSVYITPISYGGTYATGHPFWLNNGYFLLLDRCENAIELYKKGEANPISKISTSSSVHHVINANKMYFGIMEGSESIAPGVIQFTLANNKINIQKTRLLSEFSDINISLMGAHHIAMHPDYKHLFVPSTEGVVYILNADDLSLVSTLHTGKGVGHILFTYVNEKTYMVTTNHKDIYKSVFDVTDPIKSVKLKDIYFSDTEVVGKTTQSHTTQVNGNKIYFMFNDANNSQFIELNLEDLNVSRVLKLNNNYSLMGTFLNRNTDDIAGM